MLLLLLSLMGAALYFVIKQYRAKIHSMLENAEKIPGPPTLPLVGNALEFGTSTKRNKAFFTMILPKSSLLFLEVYLCCTFCFTNELTSTVANRLTQ
jgi:hypothetical protein